MFNVHACSLGADYTVELFVGVIGRAGQTIAGSLDVVEQNSIFISIASWN